MPVVVVAVILPLETGGVVSVTVRVALLDVVEAFAPSVVAVVTTR